jgi:hypothetical protein
LQGRINVHRNDRGVPGIRAEPKAPTTSCHRRRSRARTDP